MKMYLSETNVQRAKQKYLLEKFVRHVYNNGARKTNYEKENQGNYYGRKKNVKKKKKK